MLIALLFKDLNTSFTTEVSLMLPKIIYYMIVRHENSISLSQSQLFICSQHPRLKTPQIARCTSMECTQKCLSYHAQKFLLALVDDKISIKCESLQRKLYISQKQYLGQNESDKCVS